LLLRQNRQPVSLKALADLTGLAHKVSRISERTRDI
jgi:hypothetical protein